jgi:two-component system CheB/CheR fusion protein
MVAPRARKVPAVRDRTASQTPAHPSHAPPFLVAAVGASAGGLEAFSSLLRAVPPDAPLAFVLVQHLARDQPSILPELLGNVTSMTVVAARDDRPIEPRHVYVIPPDARMTVSNGHLRVRPASPQREAEGTVDALFRSVAAEYRERAVGLVLSGGAHDGSAGIREIKAVGGLTMAQQPEQAAVDGMPRSAIATGTVDAVLSVEEMGEQLARLAKHPFFSRVDDAPEAEAPADVSQLLQIFQLLRRASGIDFNSYKLPTLKRRIERRIAFHRLPGLDGYVEMLRRDPVELQRLQEELLIHVTSFFREPAAFVALEQLVLRPLLTRPREGATIRFWVPGCSTGEEAYSLAMVALELLDERAAAVSLQIFGTDVSEEAVEKARAGVYPADITAEVSPQRLRRFFTRSGGGYRISKEVRDHCVFARQDVTRDPPFSKLDLIVCRNLLIYLNQATQRKVLGIFHYALRPSGVLMLGGSESIGSRADLFATFAKKAQLYRKKGDGNRPELESTPPASPYTAAAPARKSAAKPLADRSPWDVQTDANRFLLDRYAPPAVIIDEDLRIVRSRGGTSPFLELPSGEVTVDILKMVRPELGYALRAAIQEARARGRPAGRQGLRFKVERRVRVVDLQVVPLGSGEARQLLVLFEERGGAPARAARAPVGKGSKRRVAESSEVEHELAETRRQLQAIIDDTGAANEELQSANEEILSSNEELQSTNEELDTAKEELQSTNEELTTLNDELRGRNEELAIVNSDLSNLLASVQIPIVMVTRDLRIRRITPAAEKVLNVIPSDIGRPIGHLKLNFVLHDLESLIGETIDSVSIREREVEGLDGKMFSLQIRPYKTIDNRIDGAVMILFDLSSVEEQAAALEVARSTGEALMSTIRDPILLLDSDFRVRRANHAFAATFRIEPEEVEGRFIYEVGDKDWDLPELRRLLEDVLPQRKNFEGFEVNHAFARVGQKRLLVDARRIESGRRREGVIVLVIRERERERKVANHEP